MNDLLTTGKILIVDDFAGFRMTLKSMLNRMRATDIDQAGNGYDAIKLCSENTYQIIFCDYNLGEGQDGQQVLEELHHRSLIKRGTLFFMVTAETTQAQVIGAIEYRPDAYLTKPFTGEQLEQRLMRLIEKNSALEKIHNAINSGDIKKALAACDEVIQQSPKVRFSCLRIKSELYEQQKNFDGALETYQNVIKEQPLLWAMMGIGKIYYDQGQHEKAKDYFITIRDSFPRQVNVLDWIAKCQVALGDTDNAEKTLLEAIAISPKSLKRQVSLGKVVSSLKHHDIAQKAFSKTLHEGNHSCLLKPAHFQYYYDNATEVIDSLSAAEKFNLMAQTDSIYKSMERKYKDNPSALAANLSSAAKLYSTDGQSDKALGMLSKLNTALENTDCQLSQHETEIMSENLKTFSDLDSSDKYLGKISSRLNEIKEEIKDHPPLKQPEDQLIETMPTVSLFADSDNLQVAKKLNKEGLQLTEQKMPVLALSKFREAISLSPDNSSYKLNAAHIILVTPALNRMPKLITEARLYLDQSAGSTDSVVRRKRYQALIDKLNDVQS